MKISKSKLINSNYGSLNSYRIKNFRCFSSKSILPLIFGIVIGFCLSKLLIIPTIAYPNWFTRYNTTEYSSTLFLPDVKIKKYGKIDRTLADKLYNEVRVLCWVMTNSTNHETKAKYVQQTWGTRCNKLIFMSDEVNKKLGSVDLNVGYGRDVLWAKTKEAFKYVYKNNFNDADWFLKADDDTYVILENLRYMLYTYKPEQPIYFGCKFKPFVSQGYMSGGAGYVLSKESLRRFIEIGLPDNKKCSEKDTGSEDVEMGSCLENIGVIAGDSRDSKGRRRFFASGVDSHFLNVIPNKELWYWQYAYYKISEGLECCSDYPISFHYVKPNQMHFVDFAIYHMRPFGIIYGIDRLPDKIPILLTDIIVNNNDTTPIPD